MDAVLPEVTVTPGTVGDVILTLGAERERNAMLLATKSH